MLGALNLWILARKQILQCKACFLGELMVKGRKEGTEHCVPFVSFD